MSKLHTLINSLVEDTKYNNINWTFKHSKNSGVYEANINGVSVDLINAYDKAILTIDNESMDLCTHSVEKLVDAIECSLYNKTYIKDASIASRAIDKLNYKELADKIETKQIACDIFKSFLVLIVIGFIIYTYTIFWFLGAIVTILILGMCLAHGAPSVD